MSLLQSWVSGTDVASTPKIRLTNKQVDKLSKILRSVGHKISTKKVRIIADEVFDGTHVGSNPVVEVLREAVKGLGIDIPDAKDKGVYEMP
jgi:hypothetical protein